MKRAVDIVLALGGLIVLAPVLAGIGAMIALVDGLPVLFRHLRVGRGGRDFRLYKFRTMRPLAGAEGGGFDPGDTRRVTRFGAFLRRTKLDELPQLWNVLRGDMSMVGPRPERPELLVDLALAIPFFEERMRDVKPGLTGLAQVNLHYTGEIPEGSELWDFKESLQNPFGLDETEGALADDMRAKLLYDLAYSASLERFKTFLETELGVIVKTPMVMLKKLGQ